MGIVTSPLNIVTPVTLSGSVVRLEPIRHEHAELFWDVAHDALDHIFRWIPYRMQTREDFQQLVAKALQEQERGESVVFTRVESGSTWIAPAWQRTAVNTEAKYLMLRHAFEVWGCFRVELKTDALNEKSRSAILRLGAKEEGTLRRHVVTWTGRVRDSVYFGILDSEWPDVRNRLEAKLSPRTPSG